MPAFLRSRELRRLRRNRVAVLAAATIVALMLVAAAAQLLAPYSFAAQHPDAINATPGALGIPRAIFLEAALSFLGLGIQPPTPSWGIMIAEGIGSMRFVPHVVLAPSVVLALSMLAFNFLGDGLRDVVDPKLRV